MARQIQFYMSPEDRNTFLRIVQERDPVVVTARDSESPEIVPITGDLVGSGKTLCLWNRRILPHLERKWVPEPGYYRMDTLRMPILELMPSFIAKWEAKPALGQGRLFGDFDSSLGKPEDFKKWYESLVRWIRQNYRKNPSSTGGYVGPAAYEYYQTGAYLLPNFLPPRTKTWLTEIGKQHSGSSTPPRPSKRIGTRP